MNEDYKILVVNPGATSTKMAVYSGEKPLWEKSISHMTTDLTPFVHTFEQLDFRVSLVKDALKDAHIGLSSLDAMAYQVAKAVGAMATVVCGKVDRIILTGGAAHSKRITTSIKEKVEYIAPVNVEPGEGELLALAAGALSVLRGTETAKTYS